MEATGGLIVLRVGHRPGRDDRMTTHVGLVARALGADRFVLAATDASPIERIDAVTERFGGPFETSHVESVGEFLSSWTGRLVHLTMYGLPIQSQVEAIRARREEGVAVVVGAEKVPADLYDLADWNVAVTNQPHSEVASLAIFLDRFSAGEALEQTFTGGTKRVVPQIRGKRLEEIGDG